MKALLTAYKVLATDVGISIVTLVVIGIPLKYVHAIWPSERPWIARCPSAATTASGSKTSLPGSTSSGALT